MKKKPAIALFLADGFILCHLFCFENRTIYALSGISMSSSIATKNLVQRTTVSVSLFSFFTKLCCEISENINLCSKHIISLKKAWNLFSPKPEWLHCQTFLWFTAGVFSKSLKVIFIYIVAFWLAVICSLSGLLVLCPSVNISHFQLHFQNH